MGHNSLDEIKGPLFRPWQLAVALILAIAALLFVVLPAEYGVDLTGVGSALGVNGLSARPSVQVIENPEQAAEDARVTRYHEAYDRPLQFASATIKLVPYGQAEYKFDMLEGGSLSYRWSTDTGLAYSDMHGHTLREGEEIVVQYLESDSVVGASGTIVTPFAGEHGWYFLNLEKGPQTITLEVSGFFSGQALTDLGSQLD
jgi:hypothetical protein